MLIRGARSEVRLCIPYTTSRRYINTVLLGRVALVRGVAAYSHQTFPWTICWSVGASVCPVHCGKTADQIRMPFGIIGREGVLLGANLGRAIVTNKDLLSQRRGPLPKLLWADLLLLQGVKNLLKVRSFEVSADSVPKVAGAHTELEAENSKLHQMGHRSYKRLMLRARTKLWRVVLYNAQSSAMDFRPKRLHGGESRLPLHTIGFY